MCPFRLITNNTMEEYMKRITMTFALILGLIFSGASIVYAQTNGNLVTQWGATERGTTWPILNTAETPDGTGIMGSEEGANQAGWKTIRGGFDAVNLEVGETFVISGQMEFVGSGLGEAYSPIRYALTYEESLGELEHANTDSALWTSSGSYGYEFTPTSGAGTLPNGAGGGGNVWTVINGGWNSTYSNGGYPVGTFDQVPSLAAIVEGTYDWSISYTLNADSTAEVRFYLAEQNDEYYFAGTVTDTAMTTSINAINFGLGENMEDAATLTEFNVSGVTYYKGDPIDVPLPPFESHYLTQWGADERYSDWPVLRDSSSLDGDASMGGTGETVNGWASLIGAFDYNVGAEMGEAVIVRGEMTIDGSLGAGYTPIRYAFLNLESGATLNNAYTDSAAWSGTSSSTGYSFMPRSGAADLANGNGGSGTAWWFANSNWLSTYGNNGPMGTYLQVPSLAEMEAGTYEWAMSVHPIDSLTNEIRFYMIHEDEEYYFGGTVQDTATTTSFNAVAFGFQGAEGFTQVDFEAVEVDKGDPIEVPLPPFDSHYLTQWGADSRYQGWPILRDSTSGEYLAGDAGMGGNGEPADGWASLIGAFDYDVQAEAGSALILSGEMTLNGSLGAGYTPLRFALANFEDLGELNNAYTDSAYWSQPSTNSSGYSFMPLSGAGDLANGNGGSGTNWWYANSNWLSTYGNNAPIGTFTPIPYLAEMEAGTYEWAISVEPIDDLTNEIRFYFIHEEDDYYYAGTIQDTASTTTFNAVAFGFQGVDGFTQVNFEAVEVDKGDPIEVPEPAFYDHYIPTGSFGFLGGKYGGDWTLTPGEFTGNTSVSGSAATDWAAVRAGFEVPSTPGSGDEAALVIEDASLSFAGGGFEEADSFLFGVFEAADAGVVDSTEERGYEWTGSEAMHTGYLVNPLAGTVSAIDNGVWYDATAETATEIGAVSSTGTPTAGDYDLSISVQPGTGGMIVKVSLMKEDGSFSFEGSFVDANSTATTFNGLNFAVNNSSTTGLDIEDVEITQGAGLAVSNEAERSNALPKVFALEQNYPNPFNPTTNINFDLPKSADVQLTVFNMLGQKVMTLVNERMQAGAHNVTFDARNLASGMYVYRIQAGDFTSTKKMMLIK